MRLIATRHGMEILLTTRDKVRLLASGRWKTEAMRGVIDAGRRTKTQVQNAVHVQMAAKRKTYTTQGTRIRTRQAALAVDIFAIPGGQRVEEYKGLSAQPAGILAARIASGSDQGTVRSGVWNNPRTFKRSFAAAGGFFALLPKNRGTSKVAPRILWTYGRKPGQPRDAAGRFAARGIKYGRIRRLYGPSLRNEIGEGEALDTFFLVAPVFLIEKVAKRIEGILDR